MYDLALAMMPTLVRRVLVAMPVSIEMKALSVGKSILQEMLLTGLLTFGSGTYILVSEWLCALDALGLDDDMLNRRKVSSKYRAFLKESIPAIRGWVNTLRDVHPKDSCTMPIKVTCPEHGDVNYITSEGIFADNLMSVLGLFRCVETECMSPIVDFEEELLGVAFYREMLEDERQIKLLSSKTA